MSGICFGAGLSQCTFGHSQIRLQTSGHESLLAQFPENWITFGKSLDIGSTKNSFCSWKTQSFFHALDGTDVFLGVAATTKMVIKTRPQKIHRQMPNRMYFRHFRLKRVTNIGSHDGMVRWGLPSTIAHEHQKSHSSTVRWDLFFFFSEPSPIRPRTKNYIHFSLNFGSDPATDKKQSILKGFCIENRIFFRFPGFSDPAADV